jgi:hypothetical protein
LKRDIISCSTEVHKSSSKEDTLLNLIQRISSWYRATKFVAWILHYRRKLTEAARKRKEKLCENKESRGSNRVKLTVDELKAAEKVILRCVQQKYFPEEIAVLQKQKSKQTCVKKSSPLSKLDPIFQDDLLRGWKTATCSNSRIFEAPSHPTERNSRNQYYHSVLSHYLWSSW